MLRRLKTAWLVLTGRLTYAVIYDVAELEGEDSGEQYYGWFGSPAEARNVFTMFKGGNEGIIDAKLVLVLEDMP